MSILRERQHEMRILSDEALYPQAVQFARQQGRIRNNQLTGLLEFSRTWDELTRFISHQRDRDWGGNLDYPEFYAALDHTLDDLRAMVKDRFIPEELTRRETQAQTDVVAGWLAHEFIQHLVAEMMLQREARRL
jgi:hypothetical protein